MKSPTATFYTVRLKGKNEPIGVQRGWTIFCDENDRAVTELGDKYEAVRITVEPITSQAQKTTIEAERNYWRRVAAYLASCHAASAYDVLDKKTGSKYQKKRHLELLEVCISMLKGVWPDRKLQSDDIEPEIKRCQGCFDQYKYKI